MKGTNPEAVAKDVSSRIASQLDSVGLMYRIFSRTKNRSSIDKKISGNPRYGNGKKLQDLIGVRVVLYFNDDIETVRDIISSFFSERESDVSIDEFRNDEFKAVRYNVVYSLIDEHAANLSFSGYEEVVDTTFELQIRTIFSEGWHEVEHDLRYKCKSDWEGFDYQSRKLNGVYASLETSEWTMVKIFDDLAYNHYKSKEWSAMFRQKLRIRLADDVIDTEILDVFEEQEVAKKFYRIDRSELILLMSKKEFSYPLTLSNIIYFANYFFVGDVRINELAPRLMMREMSD